MSDEEEYLPSRVYAREEVAYMMKRRGMSLSDIAEELSCEPQDVNRMIRARFKRESEEMTSEDRLNILQMENDRLDYYLKQLWPSIEFGDLKSITVALSIHDRKMKANYLDRPDSQAQNTTILVVGGAEDDYIESLKAAAEAPSGNSA